MAIPEPLAQMTEADALLHEAWLRLDAIKRAGTMPVALQLSLNALERSVHRLSHDCFKLLEQVQETVAR